MTKPNSEPGRFALISQRVVTPGGVGPAAVIVAGEQIEAVLAPDAAALAELPVEDLGRRVIMAGLVDSHVHINEPGRTNWEGYETATRAAAAGGVTTVVDMPLNCIPVTTSVEALAEKREACATKLFVDAGFWGGVIGQDDATLAALAEAGILGAKAFLCHSGIDEFPGVGEAELRPAMKVLATAGIPLLAHAELESPVSGEGEGDPRSYASYLASRPERWEREAIELLINLARETGCAVHIVHLSAASALPMIAAARAEGLALSVETCPHYLSLAAESIAAGATHFKCAPPIRERANQAQLWRGLAEGLIDMVVSDHSPCTPALKKLDQGDFGEAWGGIASLQLTLPLVWTGAQARGHDLATLARWLCAEPARVIGLASKGQLAPGCDADLCVWDPEASFEVDGEAMFMRHDLTPYQGQTLLGVVERTYLRGRQIFAAGAPLGEPRGRELLRKTTT